MLKQNVLFNLEKLIKYWASAVSAVSSNPCVGPSPRIKTFFSINIHRWAHNNSKNMTFLPMLPSGNEKSECESNLIP